MDQNSEAILCKPTQWFLIRVLAVIAMFSVFSVLFYIDGTTGYRKKNFEYYLHASFEKAASDFSRMKAEGNFSAARWEEFAKEQVVALPEDGSVLPLGLERPRAWPEILRNFKKMESQQPHLLWQEFSGENQMSKKVLEKPYDAGKIREQMIVFYLCLTLVLATFLLFLRNIRRSMKADASGFTTVTGKKIAYADMKVLDLRKWDSKGIAFIDFENAGGKGRAKIDGLIYGGFKKEQGEPAEKLMNMIRDHFSGEMIEYVYVSTAEKEQAEPVEL